MSAIRMLICGGTIDKHYNEKTGQLEFDETYLHLMLKEARCTIPPIAIQTLMLKDSLEMSDADREQIKEAALASLENHIVITHGTDRMVETAQYLAAGDLLKTKTVVLFGAMRPFSMTHSDALFNLGCAIMAVQLLPPEVYITMNGHIFAWHTVKKNRQQGVFQITSKSQPVTK